MLFKGYTTVAGPRRVFLHEQGRVGGLGVRGLGGLQLELTRPGSRLRVKGAKGYLTYKKTHHPRTLP